MDQPLPTQINSDNPWPGLASFTEESSVFFFGREKETAELVRLIRRNVLTVLFGQSGLGKSSLLQAGAFPLLRESDYFPLYVRLDHDPAAPALADQVKSALSAAFAAGGIDATAPRPHESLWEYFHRKDVDHWSAKNRLLTPVLAFDQFEEIFTLGSADETRRARAQIFLTELADLVQHRVPSALRDRFEAGELDIEHFHFDKASCHIVLSLREDFLPDLEGLKQEMRSVMRGRMRVERLNGLQALEIVQRPAPHLLGDGVAERIVEFVAGARGGSVERLAELEVEPALLSVICRELNERRRSLHQPQITSDLVSGNRREILTEFYERSVADVPEAMRTFVEDRLLTKSGFRDNLALETALEEPGVTRALINTLVGRRLLRVEDRLGIQRVELTHDVLAEVIRASRDTRQQRRRLEETRTQERITRRRLWVARAIAGVLLVLFAGASYSAWRAVQGRRLEAQAASRTDALLGSRLLEEGKTAEGLAYLVRAAGKDPTNTLLGPRLLSALTNRNFLHPQGIALALPSPAIGRAEYLSDGRTVIFQGEDDVLRAIDTAEWRVAREFHFGKKVLRDFWQLASSDNRILAVGLEDGSLVVCDVATGTPRLPAVRPHGAKSGERFAPVLSPNGRWLATSNDLAVGTVWLWDLASGQQSAPIPSTAGVVVFSPDSRLIATASGGLNGARITFGLSALPDLHPVASATAGTGSRPMFSPDGKTLLAVSQGVIGMMELFDATTGESKRAPFPTLPYPISTLFTEDGTRVIVTGDREAQVFDVAAGKSVFPPLAHGGPAYHPRLSLDGRILLTTSADGLARLWDMQTGKLFAEPTVQQERGVPAALAPDRSHLVLFSAKGPAYRLRITQSAAQTLELPHLEASVYGAFLPAAPSRVLRLLKDRAVVIDVASGAETNAGFEYPQVLSSQLNYNARTAFTPDQRIVLVRDGGAHWRVLERDQSGKVVRHTLLEDAPNFPGFTLHPSGEFAAAYGGTVADRSVGIWNLQTGRKVQTLKHDLAVPGGAYQVAFSPDGKRIGLRTSDGTVHLHDFPSGTPNATIRASRAPIAVWIFSADGSRIISGDDSGGVGFFDSSTGQSLHFFQRHRDQIVGLRLTTDGRRLLSFSKDGTAQVWDAQRATPTAGLLVHARAVLSAAFSEPDGERVVTATVDSRVQVWNGSTGQPLTEPLHVEGSTDRVSSFSPDGRFFMTYRPAGGGGARSFRIWSLPPSAGNATVPPWLLRLATICGGKRVADTGEFLSAADEMATLHELRQELDAYPASAPYVEWGRWFLSDRPDRPIAPGFTLTPAEAKQVADRLRTPDAFNALIARETDLVTQNNWVEAEKTQRQLLALALERGEALRSIHGALLVRLAQTLLALGKFEEAERLARESVAIRANLLPVNEAALAYSRATIGSALLGQKRYAEAEPMLAPACEFLRQQSQRTAAGRAVSPALINLIDSLIQLYAATDRQEKAAEWKSWSAELVAAAGPARAAAAPNDKP